MGGIMSPSKDTNGHWHASDWQQAIYLEAEWSDFILAPHDFSEQGPHTGKNAEFASPTFYKTVAELVREWLLRLKATPKRYCDVGGATGRTLFEVAKSVQSLSELVLVEPAPELHAWADRFLCSTKDIGWIPVVAGWMHCSYREITGRPFSSVVREDQKTYTYSLPVEDLPRPNGYFDLITCLNVVDRHENPAGLINHLANLLAPGGLLLVSSPLAFEEEFTPLRDRWVSDINELFLPNLWAHLGEVDLDYMLRYYDRGWIHYFSQTVIKQRKG
jgi:SAM-dependent methyltransferase